MTVQRFKRKAAAKVFYFMFFQLNTVSSQLQFNHLEWGEVFTPKEKELIERLRGRLYNDAELCRQMGHRLRGRNAKQ